MLGYFHFHFNPRNVFENHAAIYKIVKKNNSVPNLAYAYLNLLKLPMNYIYVIYWGNRAILLFTNLNASRMEIYLSMDPWKA